MNIHFHHHLGAETIAVLQNIGNPELTSRIETKLQEILKKMSDQEKELAAKLAEIQEAQSASNERGEKQIEELTTLVKALKDKAEAEAVDLSDEIATAEAILQTEREAFVVKSELPSLPENPASSETPAETETGVETTTAIPSESSKNSEKESD